MTEGTHHTVGIVQTGVANTASVRAAFRRAGVEPEVVESARQIESLDRLVVPGVGTFAAGMDALRANDLIEPIRERIEQDRPTMLVCLGMQLLCSTSDESPGVEGLGVIDGHVSAFPEGVTTPQFGWNMVEPEGETSFIRAGYAYFANSYRLDHPPDGWECARANHGGSFVAALERGSILAVQFHPELSGSFGQSLIERWLAHGVNNR